MLVETERKRDHCGRFVAGNKGGGRKKQPDALKLVKTDDQIRKLIGIADDPKTPVKVRADIMKWLVEMKIGKPRQQVDSTTTLSEGLDVQINVID